MSITVQDIKNSFNKYIRIYIGLENQDYDANIIRNKILKIAFDCKNYYVELSKIIIEHLEKDDTSNKIRLFDIIDSLFKSDSGNYVEQLNKYLYDNFKECYMISDFEDRFLLFKILYTWKYIVPKKITEKIKNDLKLDDFQEFCMKKHSKRYNEDIQKCDIFNENWKEKIAKKAIKKVLKEDNAPPSSTINTNIGQNNNPKKVDNKNLNIIEDKPKKKKNVEILGKKIKSTHETKSSESNTNLKKKKIKPDNNINNINNNINNINNNFNTQSNNIQKNINTIPYSINNNNKINSNNLIPQANMNTNNSNINTIQFINNNNSNMIPNTMNQNTEQQHQLAQLLNLLRNNQLNLINNFPFFPNSQMPNISKIEMNIFKFIFESNIKLDSNLRFFSSIAKFFNESVKNNEIIKINCEYENIYKNPEYQLIHQNVNNALFNNIKKNICVICGFRNLYYNKLTEHLDIHFNINYLKKEGKNLFRKKANNRNNWINGDNNLNKNIKNNNMNKIGYTLDNLLYYKNMINNSLIKINNLHQEEEHEEFMYPIDVNNIRSCEFCGDELKKIFSYKYHYWFYTDIVKVKDEKEKLLVHKSCYDEMIKKNINI